MAQAELHFLRARLLGGKLNKAKKGELRFPLPVGFCHDEDGHIVLDPDEEVRGAVSLVFRLFTETGSAFAVVQNFVKRALRFPKRAYGGAWNGKLEHARLSQRNGEETIERRYRQYLRIEPQIRQRKNASFVLRGYPIGDEIGGGHTRSHQGGSYDSRRRNEKER